MNKKQWDELWDEVIEHWKRVEKLELHNREWIGSNDCAFCREFLFVDDKDPCCGCPIFEYTGQEFCNSTPYDNIRRFLDTVFTTYEGRGATHIKNSGRQEEFQALCKIEREFLEKIRIEHMARLK